MRLGLSRRYSGWTWLQILPAANVKLDPFLNCGRGWRSTTLAAARAGLRMKSEAQR